MVACGLLIIIMEKPDYRKGSSWLSQRSLIIAMREPIVKITSGWFQRRSHQYS